MISYYPPVTLPYLQVQKEPLRTDLGRYFFQSWEDAIWHLVDCGFIPKGVVLIPDYYCLDVIDNLRSHGLDPMYYPLDRDLQPVMSSFVSLVKEYNPTCVVIFHADGITSNLERDDSWRPHVSKECVILQDLVHRLVNPRWVRLRSRRDIAIDSLRKTSPLSGSFLYFSRQIKHKIPRPAIHNPLYVLFSRLSFLVFRINLVLGYHLGLRLLVRLSHYRLLSMHDNLIGDSRQGNSGPYLSNRLSEHLNFAAIEKVKLHQSDVYTRLINPLCTGSTSLYIPPCGSGRFLRAFPLIVTQPLASILAAELDRIGVYPIFPDCPWSRDRLIFFLPLGPHITLQDQRLIRDTIQRAVSPERIVPEEHKVSTPKPALVPARN